MIIRSTYQTRGNKPLLPFTGKGFVAAKVFESQAIMCAGLSFEANGDWTRRHG